MYLKGGHGLFFYLSILPPDSDVSMMAEACAAILDQQVRSYTLWLVHQKIGGAWVPNYHQPTPDLDCLCPDFTYVTLK